MAVKTATMSAARRQAVQEHLTKFPRIGQTKAARIVNHFGDRVLAVLDNEPHRLAEVLGNNHETILIVSQAWRDTRNELRALLKRTDEALGLKEVA